MYENKNIQNKISFPGHPPTDWGWEQKKKPVRRPVVVYWLSTPQKEALQQNN